MIRHPGDDGPQATTQTMRAVLSLRDMIATGRLEHDIRHTEVQLAARLSMSRTPIRAALQRLTDEGVLVAVPAGGYRVRRFLPEEIAEAIEIRGMLEGLVARLLAERGLTADDSTRLTALADQMETAIGGARFDQRAIIAYSELNTEFHRAMVAACGSDLLAQEITRANARPFASASALVGMHQPDHRAQRHLWVGQDQHRAVLEAICARQGARAETIMREHARLSHRNLTRAIEAGAPLDQLGAANLIVQPQG